MNKKTIVIASDSFKGTLSSLDICHLFEEHFKDRDDLSLITLPIADGGEGSLDAISRILDGRFIDIEVCGLYFNKIKSRFFVDNNNNAFIESASVVGLSLANEDNNPGLVTTYGIGEQIGTAIDLGFKNIYVFLGGSATNDGGCGLASALGTKFYDDNDLEFILVGLNLKDINRIDNTATKEYLKDVNITVLSDVKSPFYGIEGAAYKFAKQKGASDDEIVLLDEGLKHLSSIINRDLHIDISNTPGSGAAGGLGGGLIACCYANIVSGIDAILDLIKFDDIIAKADLVISGEGKLDKQTLDGKVIDGIAKRCMKLNKPLDLIVGISEMSLKEIKDKYPCVSHIYETNEKHLPFDEIKDKARDSYQETIQKVL